MLCICIDLSLRTFFSKKRWHWAKWRTRALFINTNIFLFMWSFTVCKAPPQPCDLVYYVTSTSLWNGPFPFLSLEFLHSQTCAAAAQSMRTPPLKKNTHTQWNEMCGYAPIYISLSVSCRLHPGRHECKERMIFGFENSWLSLTLSYQRA